MTSALVAMPWRPSGSPDREQAFEHVYESLQSLDVVGVITVDADPAEPFSRARSANLAFGAARAMGTEVVVIHDSDMLVPEDSYYRTIEQAAATGRLVVAFSDYRVLNRAMSSKVYAGADPFQLPFTHRLQGFSVGGIMAMTVAAWEKVGGFDPRFTGWAPDDWALWVAAKLILGEGIRLDGPAVHLHHPSEKDRWPEHRKAGEALYARYTACATVDEVRAIRAEVDG